jgi:hypothetical protein
LVKPEPGGDAIEDGLFALALHEAAHMVSAIALGCKPIRVAIIKGDHNHRGATNFSIPAEDETSRLTEGIIAAAGPLAEQRMYGANIPDKQSASRDIGVEPLVPDERLVSDSRFLAGMSENHRGAVCAFAEQILDEHWARILALAEELARIGSITESVHLRGIRNWWTQTIQE